MINFTYKLTTYKNYLHQLADMFGTTVSDDKLTVPAAYGSGFFRLIQTDNGPEALLYDFTLNDTLVLRREQNDTEFYTLVYDNLDRERSFRVVIGSESSSDAAMDRSSVFYLTSFLYHVESVLYKGVNIKGIRILLAASWMQHYLQLSEKEAVLEKYIALKAAGIWYKPVNEEPRTLLLELLNCENAPLLFCRNRVFRIIELFFEWLYNEMKVTGGKTGISRHDIEMAQKVETLLTTDVTKLPPTIKELAREAAMSESKLKKIFKTVYGLPPYEYYQQQRMQKARLMLLSGDYSVKDIGYTLGYVNLSNFTLAFKKVFGKLPSEVLRSNAK
jgi:AraC-like DNA-binding protein